MLITNKKIFVGHIPCYRDIVTIQITSAFFVLLILLIYSCKLILVHVPLFLSCCDGYGVQWIEPEFSARITGIVLGLYEDSRYKSASKKVHLKQVDIIGLGYGAEMDQRQVC